MKTNQKLDPVDSLIEKEIEAGTFPGGVLLIKGKENTLKHRAYGLKSETPGEEAMELGTIFDLASLTKVVATTTIALHLVETGNWNLDNPVSKYLARFHNQDISLKHLLTHTSGLIPWTDLFSGTGCRDEALSRLFTDNWPILEPVVPPGERVIYSDLNFILLGLALEEVGGGNLEQLAREHVFDPLGMANTGFKPEPEVKQRIAPTEDSPIRGEVIRGEVHDQNCYALGGVSGHAGLFSTAEDLGRFSGALLNGGSLDGNRILGEATVNLLSRNFTKGAGDRRTLGWQLQGEEAETSGDLLSPESFGHTGFTGGSIWLDPANGLATVFLSNRVHPERNRGKERMADFRAKLHNAVLSRKAGSRFD